MKILIVDDSNSKVLDLVSSIAQFESNVEIDSCRDCITAFGKLTTKYDLLLLDLLLPLRSGDDLSDGGGKYIIKEVYRNFKLKPPTYILCITQHDEHFIDFHPVWRTIKYSPGETEWKDTLTDLLKYVVRQHASDNRIIIEKMPSIYFEGKVDEQIYQETLRLYFPEYIDKIRLKAEKGAGADWVTRQLVVWASSLPRDENSEYIKCVGIYDDDSKGIEAIEQLHKTIPKNSAEQNCIKALKYSTRCAKHLIPIYKKGISLPITLEEMFEYKYWIHAHEMGWVEARSNPDMLLKDPGGWDKMKMSLGDHIASLGFSKNEKLYFSKISAENKQAFCDYILRLAEEERKHALEPISIMLQDAIGAMFKPTN
jgi:hypothetical protein